MAVCGSPPQYEWQYQADSIDDCFIPSNYKEIIARISARPLREAKIRLNTKMTSLDSLKLDDVHQTSVRLRTKDSQEEDFDYVVVTAPLGWLKLNKKVIAPLSDRISKAIDNISYGNLEKVRIPRTMRMIH